jgi:hypothetical protein
MKKANMDQRKERHLRERQTAAGVVGWWALFQDTDWWWWEADGRA